jgi:ElaB/YqjD/DUF883 family membrane-anchored ribosome-binding protein
MNDKATTEAEIERTVAALASKARELEQRVVRVKARVEHMFDPHEQMQEKPWRFVGTAFAAGFVLGLLG